MIDWILGREAVKGVGKTPIAQAQERIAELKGEVEAQQELLDRLKARFDQPDSLHTYIEGVHSAYCAACVMRKWFSAMEKQE